MTTERLKWEGLGPREREPMWGQGPWMGGLGLRALKPGALLRALKTWVPAPGGTRNWAPESADGAQMYTWHPTVSNKQIYKIVFHISVHCIMDHLKLWTTNAGFFVTLTSIIVTYK